MSARPVVLLVVARAPVPGEAKTRLIPALGAHGAAEVAAAALLDSLDVVAAAASRHRPVVALTGDVARSARRAEVTARLAGCTVIPQRGATFAGRLVHAHADAARAAGGEVGVLQIGMDTPQVTAALLRRSAARLDDADAVLGPADDGGWWLLGLRDAGLAGALAGVPMSTPHTGRDTRNALVRRGAVVVDGPGLRDVDTVEDARAVAARTPGSRFAAAVHAAAGVPA